MKYASLILIISQYFCGFLYAQSTYISIQPFGHSGVDEKVAEEIIYSFENQFRKSTIVTLVSTEQESDFMNQLGVKKVELDDLLAESHFVTLHSPLIPATENMFGNEQFKMMRNDAFLINCARGGLIDEDALHEALNSQNIAGAGVDVLVDIKPDTNHRLIKNQNVIVTPHTAFFSQEAVLELEERAAGQVGNVLLGKIPENIVNVGLLKADNLRADIK